MSDYIERNALLYDIRIAKMLAFGILETKLVEDIIEQQPTADVVEVVRCKDCVYYENFLCGRFSAYGDSVEEPEYDYCSYGERREDDKGRSNLFAQTNLYRKPKR